MGTMLQGKGNFARMPCQLEYLCLLGGRLCSTSIADLGSALRCRRRSCGGSRCRRLPHLVDVLLCHG